MSPIGGGHHPLHQQHLPSGGDTIREEVRQPAVVDSLVDVDGKAEKRRNRDSGVGALSADGLGNGSGVMDVPIVAGDGSSRTKESDYTSASDEEDEDMGKRPKPGWWAVTVAGLKAFWKWFITPMV